MTKNLHRNHNARETILKDPTELAHLYNRINDLTTVGSQKKEALFTAVSTIVATTRQIETKELAARNGWNR
jgi:hypothetical protein